MKFKNRTVRLEEIVVDPRAQTRADGIDESHVAQMVDGVKDLPPPICIEVDGQLRLADGFHRLRAFRIARMIRVTVMVSVGTEDDWVDAFASANDEQKGKHRTRDDKRNSVVRVLEMRPNWSNRRIAEAAKVGDQLVATLRPSASPQLRDHAVDTHQEDKREGKDGRMRPATQPGVTATGTAESAPKPDPVAAPEIPVEPEPAPASEPVVEPTPEPVPTAPANTVDESAPAEHLDPCDAFCQEVSKICRDLDAIGMRIESLKESPYAHFVHWSSAKVQIKNGRESLWQGRPLYVCPYCRVAGEVQPACRCCRGLNVTTKSSYKAGVDAVGGEE